MIIKPARKLDVLTEIQIKNHNGTYQKLIKKDHIKYLGVIPDDTICWRYHIPYKCSRISRGIGIISKLLHYLSIKQLLQMYYTIIYPYISYAILAWGSTYSLHI